MLPDATLIATTAIIRALLEHPGQSKYSLASELVVPSDVLERQLQQLERQGLIVTSAVTGDDEPIFWATHDAAQGMGASSEVTG
jgi:predicted ArsR family transcriptional regulator